MTAPVAAGQAAATPLSSSEPRQPGEQSIRRFKALLEQSRDPSERPAASPEDQAGPSAVLMGSPEAPIPVGRWSMPAERDGHAAPEKTGGAASPAPEALPVPSSLGDRIAELQKASQLALGLDHAHARPTATQLLMGGQAMVAGGTIAQGSVPGAIDIAIHPGSQLLTADNLDALRRRLASKGLVLSGLRIASPDEDEARLPAG